MTWNDLKKLNIKKRISDLKRSKELYDAEMNGRIDMFKTIAGVGEFEEFVLQVVNAIRRIEDELCKLSFDNLDMIVAIREGLMSIENRLKKLEELNEYR